MADDIFTFFNSLSPEDQQQFLMNFGTPDQQQQAFSADMPDQLGGIGAPQQDPTSMMLSLLAGSGSTPQLTTKGAVDPVDLSQLAQRLNYTQDIGGSMFDNAVALFAGPDAFGSMDQFTPITRYTGSAVPAQYGEDGTPSPVTKSSLALSVAKKSGGARGFIADLIDKGMDPDAAVAALRDVVTNGVNATDPKLKQQAQDIRRTLDVWRTNDPLTGAPAAVDRAIAPWESFDENSLRKTAQDMFDQKLTDEMSASTLEFDPQTGKYYQGKTTEDSPAAKKFRDAGLPLPGEQYTDPARLDAMNQGVDPGYQQQGQMYQAQDQSRADDLETQRQKILANELNIQKYDQNLKSQSTPYNPFQLNQPGAHVPAPQGSNPMFQQPAAQAQQPAQSVPGTVSPLAPAQPQQIPQHLLSLLAARGPSQTTPNPAPLGPTMPHAQQQQAPMRDSFGNLRTPNTGAFDFKQLLFPQSPLEQKQAPLYRGDAQGARQKNQADQQKWVDQYNKNYAAQNRRPSTAAESNADFLRGAMRARAQVSTPLQDTMLARLLSLKGRAGI